ncbi:hypothetical protein SDC9_154916 [bioreactor metagenome]|uniref:Uncharacterized protein n=1 Tax=bioreactor metagenome TaxID=1076179 RepID=A0A645F014_9ZZZZ
MINKEDNLLKENKIAISHLKFVQKASIVYGESSAGYNIVEKYEFYAIASVNMRNKVAFGISSELAINFRNTSALKRNNNVAMKFSTAAVINALLGGTDYSNGAKQWDGAEQTHLPTNNPDILSNGRFMFKVHVMGWKINDEHFTSWKNAVNGKFGVNYFNAPQMKYAVANYGGMKNKDKIRLQSVAQYGLTMFWKEVNIIKP